MDNLVKKRTIIKEYLDYKTNKEYGFVVGEYLELNKRNTEKRIMNIMTQCLTL
jgi:hypothetical protein